jgi:hypothetical protein
MIAEGFSDETLIRSASREEDKPSECQLEASMDNVLVCQLWSIKKSGNPTIEGKFCSLHTDEKQLQKCIRQYWGQMPNEVPDSFACPAEDATRNPIAPYKCRVDPSIFKRVRDSGPGLWCTTVPQPTVEAVSLIPPQELMSLTEGMM